MFPHETPRRCIGNINPLSGSSSTLLLSELGCSLVLATTKVYANLHGFLPPSRHLSKKFPEGSADGAGSGAPRSASFREPPTTQGAHRGWKKKITSGLAIVSNLARRGGGRRRPPSAERRGWRGRGCGRGARSPGSKGEGAGSRAPGVRMRARRRSGWAERGGGGGGRGGVVISVVRTVRGGAGDHGRSR